MRKVCNHILSVSAVSILLFSLVSCSSKDKEAAVVEEPGLQIEEIKPSARNHQWYCFTDKGFTETDLPQNAPEVLEKPWTEAVRISSAAAVPSRVLSSDFDAYAIVNRLGMLAFKKGSAELYPDASIFSIDTADQLVFSGEVPVFYLYRSTFFNEKSQSQQSVLQSRPFLVEFDPSSKVCYPLVSYANLNLQETDQISGFFWNGSKWACSVKSQVKEGVEFSYFCWEPLLELTDLSPALNRESFIFSSSSEAEYRGLNMPHLFSEAPKILKNLLKGIPEQFPVYVSWRDSSGTSPVNYFQEGNGTVPLNACAFACPSENLAAAVFEDGTTYIQKTDEDKSWAFRLPRLPASYTYSDGAVSGSYLIVAWEQKDFYKTGKSGFITVNLDAVLK